MLPGEPADRSSLSGARGSPSAISASAGWDRRISRSRPLAKRSRERHHRHVGSRPDRLRDCDTDVSSRALACYSAAQASSAPTIGALDVRAQSVGFLSGPKARARLAAQTAPGGDDGRDGALVRGCSSPLARCAVERVDLPGGPRALTPRLADGAAAAVVGPAEAGLRIGAIRGGKLTARSSSDSGASSRRAATIRTGSSPRTSRKVASTRGSIPEGLRPIARERPASGPVRDVLEDNVPAERQTWIPSLIDQYAGSRVTAARRIAAEIGVEAARTTVPTALFGHVMAAGLPIALERLASERGSVAACSWPPRVPVFPGAARRGLKEAEEVKRLAHPRGRAAVPPRIVTNDELSRRMDTSDEWIQQRTGIRERRYVEVATGATELGARAAEAALAEAKLDITDIDLVVFRRRRLSRHRLAGVRRRSWPLGWGRRSARVQRQEPVLRLPLRPRLRRRLAPHRRGTPRVARRRRDPFDRA